MKGGKGAPRTFKGDPLKVTEFLDDLDQVILASGLTTDTEKFQALKRYCSSSVRAVLEAVFSTGTLKWTEYLTEFKRLYDADKYEKRYKPKDLRVFLRKARHRTLNSIGKFRTYYREFHRIAGWLKTHKYINEETFNKSFWQGIPRALRPQIESQYLRKNSAHVMTSPFEVGKLTDIIESMFGRNRFDAADSDSEADGDSDTESSFSDSSSDDSDSDSDSDYKHKHHKYSHKKKTKKYSKTKEDSKHSSKDKSHNDANSAEVHSSSRSSSPAQPNNDREVEDIIRRLQNMSLSDPAYAALYYRAFKLDKDIVHIIRPPKDASTSPYSRPTNSTFSQNSGSFPMTCYGCGEQGHHMNSCPKITDLVLKGVLKKDGNNKLVFADGSNIQRQRDETILHAVQRTTNQTNYVTYSAHIVEVHTDYSSNSDSDNPNFIFPAERPPKKNKEARKTRFEGVFLPPKPAWAKGKEAEKPQASGSGQEVTLIRRLWD